MNLRQRLWDVVYAMAEPLVKMDIETKQMGLLMLALVLYIRIAGWLGLDSRVVVGTALGTMLGTATFLSISSPSLDSELGKKSPSACSVAFSGRSSTG